jgi:K+-transporting ATPase A subunit
MATKVNLTEGLRRPAPRWWRNFERGMLLVIIPAAVAILQGWGLDDAKSTKAMLLINIGLVALIKFIGMCVYSDEDNYVSNLPQEQQAQVDVNAMPEKK